MANNYIRRYLLCGPMGMVMTAAELQAAILATQKTDQQYKMSPERKRDLQRHLQDMERR